MVRIRLRRVGAKKQPSYRVVIADSRAPRDGGFIEVIGSYNPRTEPETVRIKEDRALYWLSVGAQPSDPVTRLLKNQGTLARLERLAKGEPLAELVAEAAAVLRAAPDPEPETHPEASTPVDTETSREETQGGSDTEPVEVRDESPAGDAEE